MIAQPENFGINALQRAHARALFAPSHSQEHIEQGSVIGNTRVGSVRASMA
jgi:hypothetical protein